METLKAGTRCECRGCDVAHHSTLKAKWCARDAVRLVEVPGPTEAGKPISKGIVTAIYPHILMCAACAPYHEAKAGSR